MGTQFEKRDLFLNPVPSNVGEDDIKKALAVYHISTLRVTVRQRLEDNTRFAFVTPHTPHDFEQMKQVGMIMSYVGNKFTAISQMKKSKLNV